MAYGIWANHAHVFPAGAKPGGEIEKLKELMAACGIEKAVCFTCFRDQYERAGLPGDPVGWLSDAIRDDASLIGFGTVDFDRDDIAYQTERIAGLGLKGIKIHPAAQEINIMGGKAQEVYRVAQEKGLFLFCYENETVKSVKECRRQSDASRVTLLIGPEGGFTPEEAAAVEAHGGISVTMGSRILRAETAAVAALSVVQYEKGDLGG